MSPSPSRATKPAKDRIHELLEAIGKMRVDTRCTRGERISLVALIFHDAFVDGADVMDLLMTAMTIKEPADREPVFARLVEALVKAGATAKARSAAHAKAHLILTAYFLPPGRTVQDLQTMILEQKAEAVASLHGGDDLAAIWLKVRELRLQPSRDSICNAILSALERLSAEAIREFIAMVGLDSMSEFQAQELHEMVFRPRTATVAS